MNINHYKHLIKQAIDKLYSYQSDALTFMQAFNKGTICFPTATGKSFIFFADILHNISKYDISVIATHRLMLNSQHLSGFLKQFYPLLGNVGFIFVGSIEFTTYKNSEKTPDEKTIERLMNNTMKNHIDQSGKKGISWQDVMLSTTSSYEIEKRIREYKNKKMKVVIISTYHSLDRLSNIEIGSIYCDEAHTLATTEMSSKFKTNFMSLTFSRSYFFTATPKDSFNEKTEAFLMNNTKIFGERHGLEYKEAIDKGYITKPVVHIATPTNFDPSKKFQSTSNYVKFIKEIFDAHRLFVKSSSAYPDKIAPKLLIKCPSVPEMWNILKSINKNPSFQNIHVFAGASKCAVGVAESPHKHNINVIPTRDDFLFEINKLKLTDEAIILHYDIFSEGIDVPALTGTTFLSNMLPSLLKLLQNVGRAARLWEEDRKKRDEGKISSADYSKWIKPYCSVILPIMDVDSQYVVDEVSETIKKLRDRYGFDSSYIVSEGDDISKPPPKKESPENQSSPNTKNRLGDFITSIKHKIEDLDALDDRMKFSQKLKECNNDTERVYLLKKELGI